MYFFFLSDILIQRSNYFTELPWDQPKSSCPEFVAWEGISYTFVTPWAKLNNLALSLLRKILSPTPSTRINMDNLKKHKWCTMKFLHEGKYYCLIIINCTLFHS